MMLLRIRIVALIAALLSFGAGAALGAGAFRVHLPIARSALPASVCSPSAPLLDQDTGSLSAGLDLDGNYIVAYQDRAHSGRGVVMQHIGARLVDVPAPSLAALALLDALPVPQFSPPDSVKVGAVALVLNTSPRRMYFTQRRPGDTTGPYGIWCLEF